MDCGNQDLTSVWRSCSNGQHGWFEGNWGAESAYIFLEPEFLLKLWRHVLRAWFLKTGANQQWQFNIPHFLCSLDPSKRTAASAEAYDPIDRLVGFVAGAQFSNCRQSCRLRGGRMLYGAAIHGCGMLTNHLVKQVQQWKQDQVVVLWIGAKTRSLEGWSKSTFVKVSVMLIETASVYLARSWSWIQHAHVKGRCHDSNSSLHSQKAWKLTW